MSTKYSKTLKKEATKKVKTGATKAPKSRTPYKVTMSRTLRFLPKRKRVNAGLHWANVYILNSKDIWTTMGDENLSLSCDVTQASTLELSFNVTTPSGEDRKLAIRIGPKGWESVPTSEILSPMAGSGKKPCQSAIPPVKLSWDELMTGTFLEEFTSGY